MGKINIISKIQGKGIYKSKGEKWEYFLKISNAEISENDEFITIIASDGTEIIANKSYVYANNDKFITYRINLDYGGGLQILLSKFKKEENTFELKGFYEEGFRIKFEGNSGYEDESLNDPNFNPEFTKRQFLNNQELPILFQGLFKNLFVKPEKGYLLFEGTNGGGNLYFDKDYYEELKDSINEKYQQGKFAESNAESDWMNLKYKIDNAETVVNPDVTTFKNYSI